MGKFPNNQNGIPVEGITKNGKIWFGPKEEPRCVFFELIMSWTDRLLGCFQSTGSLLVGIPSRQCGIGQSVVGNRSTDNLLKAIPFRPESNRSTVIKKPVNQ